MGNEAIARGALEAGVRVAAGYPGTPSSEIIETLSRFAETGTLYVEWSTNEKVAMEVAAAASFAGLRSLCVMKQNGVNVASDFLLHLTGSGTRGGMVLVTCDDPGALSSVNEGESRHFARLMEIPLLEPADFQEAKEMTRWAFALSEEIRSIVMLRSVTRMSHASGNVVLGALPPAGGKAEFRCDGPVADPERGPMISAPVIEKHRLQQEKIRKATALFETSPFNTYSGPETAGAPDHHQQRLHPLQPRGRLAARRRRPGGHPQTRHDLARPARASEAAPVDGGEGPDRRGGPPVSRGAGQDLRCRAGAGDRDQDLLRKERRDPPDGGRTESRPRGRGPWAGSWGSTRPRSRRPIGKSSGRSQRCAPRREQTFCPGCPHRASFWSIREALQRDSRGGFVCGDIGCYAMASLFPAAGFHTSKTLHAMGSGTGMASGFGKLEAFGMEQPVIAVCGDSTFYHAAIPALINAVHQNANIIFIALDNSGTAMTGFQPHPGTEVNAMGEASPMVDIAALCAAMGTEVVIGDPFALRETRETLNRLLEADGGVKVLILKQSCALSPEKKGKKQYLMQVDETALPGGGLRLQPPLHADLPLSRTPLGPAKVKGRGSTR